MSAIILDIYTFELRKGSKTLSPGSLFDKAYSSFGSFKDFVNAFYEKMSPQRKDDDKKRSLQIDNEIPDGHHMMIDQRKLACLFNYGDFGREGRIITEDESVTKKGAKDVVDEPYYALFHFPKQGSRCYIALQRRGRWSMATMLNPAFSSFVNDHSSLRIDKIDLVAPPAFVEKIINEGMTSKVIVSQSQVPRDIAELYGADDNTGPVEIQLHIKAKGPLSGIKNAIPAFQKDLQRSIFTIANENNQELGNSLQWNEKTKRVNETMQNLGLAGETKTIVVMEYRNKKRKVNLTGLDKFVPSYDITDDVDTNPETGHPDFVKIHELAQEFIDEIIESTLPVS